MDEIDEAEQRPDLGELVQVIRELLVRGIAPGMPADLFAELRSMLQSMSRTYALTNDPHAQYLRDFTIQLGTILSRVERQLQRGSSFELVKSEAVEAAHQLDAIIEQYRQYLLTV